MTRALALRVTRIESLRGGGWPDHLIFSADPCDGPEQVAEVLALAIAEGRVRRTPAGIVSLPRDMTCEEWERECSPHAPRAMQ